MVQYFSKRALDVIERAQNSQYANATIWLSFVRDAHRALGREQDWQNLKRHVLSVHARKRSLIPQIKRL